MHQRAYGDRAILVELDPDDPGDPTPAALRTALTELMAAPAGPVGFEDLVPAARTLLVRYDAVRTDAATITRAVEAAVERVRTGPVDDPTEPITVPVRYNGADLAAVAAHIGASENEVVRRHTTATYRVAFCGFAPGFAYLTGLDPTLRVPRLDSPRAAVPAGAVAIAGDYTAAYPRASPGGWNLLGVTDAALWDVTRTAPALLTPGARVRFEALR